MSVGIAAFDGVDELDLVGVFSVLTKLAQRSDRRPPAVLLGAGDSIKTASGLRIDIERIRKPYRPLKALVLPGGRQVERAAEQGTFDDLIDFQIDSGAHIYAICTGSLLLKRHGRLKDKTVAFHRGKTHLLVGSGVKRICGGMIRDGWLTTVGGSFAASVKSVDVGFEIVRNLYPQELVSLETRMETFQGRQQESCDCRARS